MDRHKHGKGAITLLVLLMIGGMARAQTREFAPIGAEWHYGIKQFSTEGYVRLKSVSDTIINGILCKCLEKRYFLFDHLSGIENEFVKGYEYVFPMEDSVMIYRFGQFYKLYDFTAEIGDTVSFPGSYSYYADEFVLFGDSIGEAVVVGKGTEEIGGLELRYYDLRKVENSAWAFDQDFYMGYSRIYERIGNGAGYLFPEQQTAMDYNEGGTFRCYTDNEIGTINLSVPIIECDYFHDVEENTLIPPAVYPNPATTWTTINYSLPANVTKASLTITNSLGMNMYNTDLEGAAGNKVIDLRGFATGVYIYTIQYEQSIETGKMVITR